MTEHFYVTIVRSPRQRGFLLGPYSSKESAELMVDLGRALALKADHWATFDAFGVTKLTTGKQPVKAVFGAL
jgi:hypothetical protein